MRMHADLLGLGAEIAAFLTAATCAGCDVPGRLLCGSCRSALVPTSLETVTPGGLAVRAALPFDGVAARCIRRLKGEGETHLIRPLAAALSSPLQPWLVESAAVVPVPTSARAFRRRGYRVPEMLLRQAGARPLHLLTVASSTHDQRGLGADARAANIRGSMRARRAARGGEAVVVDDVVTTGATIDEAARALRAAGFDVIGAVALAATPRRRGSDG